MGSEPSLAADLETLGERVSQMIELLERLRAENEDLRGQIAQAQAGDHDDMARGEEVKQKLVALLRRLEGL